MRRAMLLLMLVGAILLACAGVVVASTVNEKEPNDTRDEAQNIDNKFSLDADPNIFGDTSIPHASVQGTGNDTYDYYSFTVSQAFTDAIIDIDSASPQWDSYLRLYDGNGNLLSEADNSFSDQGSEGNGDSFLRHFFPSAGTYYLKVSASPDQVIPTGQDVDYWLHVSITNHPTSSDSIPPTIDVSKSGKTVEATGPDGATVSYTAPTVTDNVDNNLTADCSPASGSPFPLRSTTVTCTATDSAGNVASGSFKVTVRDTTEPDLTLPNDITAEATDPTGAAVSYTASATDLVDGSIDPSCSPASSSTFALGSKIVDCSATDAAGNMASGSFSVKVQDTTPPSDITFKGNVKDGDSFYYADVPASPTCDASDAVGLKDCVVTGYSTSVGTQTLTATATDNTGNSATKTLSYTVKGWTFNGFYQPVDMSSSATSPVWNTVKGGSTVPIKFELVKGTTELTDTANVVTPLTAKGVNCAGSTTDDIELTATGGTSLRYDTTAGQFVYNWQTPKGPADSCYQVTISAKDGSSKTAYFKLK